MGVDPISLGIEALAGPALLEGGSKGAEAAAGSALGAGLGGAAEAGAITLPEIAVTAPAVGAFGAGDAAAGIGLGAGGAAAGGGGIGDLFGIGSAQAGGAGVPSPNDLVASGFDSLNTGIADGTVQPTGGTTPNSFAAPDQITPTPIQTTSITSPSAPTPGAAGGVGGAPDLGGTPPVFGPDSSLAPPGAGVAGTNPSSGGIGDLIGKLGTNTEAALTKPGNLLSAALAAPLLKQLISPPKIPQQQNLQNLQGVESQFAAQQNNLGKTLTDPLVSGQLPAGAEQAVSNAIQDAITSTKARYASLGLSGSTAEADAISNIQNQGTAQRFNIAEQMAQTGLSATSQAANTFGLQDQVFTALMNAQVTQDTGLQQALARFAGAAAGGGNNVNLRLS